MADCQVICGHLSDFVLGSHARQDQTCSKDDKVHDMCDFWPSSPLIEVMCVRGGMGGPKVAKVSAFTDECISGSFFILVSSARQDQNLFRSCSSPIKCSNLGPRAI
jgi:hypothetical protein